MYEWTRKVEYAHHIHRATLCISAVFAVAQCPSVCPSVRHVGQTAEDIVKLLCRPGSPVTLVFFTLSANTQFQREPLQRGRKIQGDGNILRFSTEIAVSYYRTLIGNHTQSIEWNHFQ